MTPTAIWIDDVGIASPSGSSIRIEGHGEWRTPPGYKPAGAVSLFCTEAGARFAARCW